jgi:hypothetical protein
MIDNSNGNNKNTKNRPGWNVKETKKGSVGTVQDNQGRVDLDPRKFDKVLLQKGVNIRVYRSFWCPNVKSIDGGEHEIDCPMCNGSGYIDVDPIDTVAFIQNQDVEKNSNAMGYYDGNTVMITFPTGVELQYFARIDLLDYTENYYQRVLRATGSLVDVLKYKAMRVHSVIDKNAVRYHQGVDFNLDGNGSIVWVSGKAPADSVIYSVYYEMNIQYRAVKAAHVARFTPWRTNGLIEYAKLPEQWMCQKEFLLRRKDINTNNDLQTQTYDPARNDTTGQNDGEP